MTTVAEVPPTIIVPINGGMLIADDEDVILATDAQQWAYSAQAEFEIPGIKSKSRVIAVGVEIEAGLFGVGWLTEDGQDWIARASASPGARAELRLVIPAGTAGGKLIFDNWAAGGEPARGRIRSIKIFETGDDDTNAESQFCAGFAEEQAGNTEAAIFHYKAALQIDRSHVGSIAGLGRLRFAPPKQPLLSELNRRAPVQVCEVIIAVRNPCNYRCFFCVAAGSNNEPVKPFNFVEIEKAYEQLESPLIVTSLECGGGEPTVHPQFRELLGLCGRFGPISMPTNNSQNPERWLPPEMAKKLEVRAALHPEGEEHLDKYFKYAKFLIEHGADFRCSFIAHPTRLSKIPKYNNLFREHDIPFIAVPFIGSFENKLYPYSYSKEEFDLVRYWGNGAAPRMRPDQAVTISPHVNRIRNFRGISCIAGYRYIYIAPDGRMQRCLYDGQTLDAPLTAAQPCQVKSCGCGLFLEKLNFSQNADFYNYFSSKANLPAIPLDWKEPLAQSLGYENAESAIAHEHIAMYDSLMAAYGKDEFPE